MFTSGSYKTENNHHLPDFVASWLCALSFFFFDLLLLYSCGLLYFFSFSFLTLTWLFFSSSFNFNKNSFPSLTFSSVNQQEQPSSSLIQPSFSLAQLIRPTLLHTRLQPSATATSSRLANALSLLDPILLHFNSPTLLPLLTSVASPPSSLPSAIFFFNCFLPPSFLHPSSDNYPFTRHTPLYVTLPSNLLFFEKISTQPEL